MLFSECAGQILLAFLILYTFISLFFWMMLEIALTIQEDTVPTPKCPLERLGVEGNCYLRGEGP